MEDKVLITRIGYLGHVLDKRSTTGRGTRESLLATFGTELEQLLSEWDKRGNEPNSTVKWAKAVLTDLKNGKEVAPESKQEKPYDILSLVQQRRSIRKWSEEDVSYELINELLEAARWAPSSCNRQTVRVVVLRSKSYKEAAVELNERFLLRAPVIILVGVDLRPYTPAELKGAAPYLDAAAAIQNMLLVGHDAGLGCLWAKAAVEDWEYTPKKYFDMKKALNLPSWFRPVTLVAVGWPAKISKAPGRQELSEFVRYDGEGFEPDDFPEWRPKYFRLFLSKNMRRVRKLAKKIQRKLRQNPKS
jgi:nitroreductase